MEKLDVLSLNEVSSEEQLKEVMENGSISFRDLMRSFNLMRSEFLTGDGFSGLTATTRSDEYHNIQLIEKALTLMGQKLN